MDGRTGSRREVGMTCGRCRGLMVAERFFDLESTHIHSDG